MWFDPNFFLNVISSLEISNYTGIGILGTLKHSLIFYFNS